LIEIELKDTNAFPIYLFYTT